MARNLLLLVLSLTVTACGLELVLRQLFPVPAVWREPQARHLRSPLLGWVLKPGNGSYTIDAPVSVNSLGLRDDEMPRAKPEGETRILCLGDSFTFALGVRFEDLYVQKLERRLNEELAPLQRVQVINAGVAGYNTRQELVYLLGEGFSLEPDVITLGFYWNDLIGNEEPIPDVGATPRLLPAAVDHEQRTQRHTLPPWLRDRLRQSLLLYLGVTRSEMLWHAWRPPNELLWRLQRALLAGDDAELEPYWEVTGRRLRELAAAARERGVPVVLLAFPDENQVRHGKPQHGIGPRLAAIWGATGMPMVDLEPAYRAAVAAGQNPYLPYDLHPGEVGMQIAADALHQALHEHRLLRSRGEALRQ